MGLDDELCQKARELYGWEMKFEGDIIIAKTGRMVEIFDWLKTREENVSVAIGCETIENRPCYGFVDLNSRNEVLYQPFATVYPGREHNCEEDLIRAALLHLRRSVSGRMVEIKFPSQLAPHVRTHHLYILEPENAEIRDFLGGVVPIYHHGNLEAVRQVLGNMRIPLEGPHKD